VAAIELEQPHVFSRAGDRLVQRESPLAVRGMDTRAPQRAISVIVPRPAQPFAGIQLVRGGTVVATRSFGQPPASATAAAAPSLARRADGTLLLRWGSPTAPALVRYTADDGRTWTVLGVDVLGGALSVDAAGLPDGAGRFEVTTADSLAPAARVAAP
jgi:hypothetical protein